jgi:hypothetical protein
MPIDSQTRLALRARTSCGLAPGCGAGFGAEGAVPRFFFLCLFSCFCSAAALRFSFRSLTFFEGADDGGVDGEDREEPPDRPLRFFVSCFPLVPTCVVEGRGAVGEVRPVAPAALTVCCDDLLPPPHETSSSTSANGTNAIVRPQPVTSQAQG